MSPQEHVEAVQKLFLKNAAVLQGFISAFVPDFSTAEDVFQELFITVTRLASKFTLGTDFLAWARATAKLKIIEAFRKLKAGPRPLRGEVVEALCAAFDETPDAWESKRETLARCLDRLAPRAREVIELRYSEDGPMPPAEIARRLSWTVDSVNVALSRARKFLRECAQEA